MLIDNVFLFLFDLYIDGIAYIFLDYMNQWIPPVLPPGKQNQQNVGKSIGAAINSVNSSNKPNERDSFGSMDSYQNLSDSLRKDKVRVEI